MPEYRYFVVSPSAEREEALRIRLVGAAQTNMVGSYRIGETPGDYQVLLTSARPEVLIFDSQTPPERALELAMKSASYLPRLVSVILMPEKDFDFLQASVKAGVDLTLVEPVNVEQVMQQAGEMVRNKLRSADWERVGSPGQGAPAAADPEGELLDEPVIEYETPPPPAPAPAPAPAPDPLAGSQVSGGGGTVLGFISAKDGEGKSTVALNLAMALGARYGRRAIYVDLGEVLSETAMMLNTQAPGTYLNCLALPPEEFTMEGISRFAIDYFEDGSVLAICGNSSIVPPEIDRDKLDLFIRYLRSQCDFLILDCPVSFGDNLKVALKLADWHVAVVQNTLSSLRNTRAYLAELRRLEYPSHQVRVVLNRVSLQAGLSKEDLTRNLDPYPIVCAIVSNGKVAIEALNVGKPVMLHSPDSDLAESISNFAKALLGIESSDVLSSQGFTLTSMFSSIFGK